MSEIRFGLIGAGVIGRLRAAAISNVSDARLVAVFDVNHAAGRELAKDHDAEPATSVERLVERSDIEAVIVSSPPQFHEDQVLAALEAGKHVLCEKPLSNSLESCATLVRTAAAGNRVLTTGFNHRFFPAIKYMRETIDQGLIGDLDHIRAFAGHPGLSEFREPWEYDRSIVGGGALMDVGIHMIDLTHYLLGDAVEVFGKSSGDVWNLDGSEDNAFALIRNRAGRYASLQATWSEWRGYRFHISAYGTTGMVRAYYAPMMAMRVIRDASSGERRTERKFYPANILREKLRGWQSTVETTFSEEIAEFIRICCGEEAHTIARALDGYRAVEIADAVYRCNESNEPVRLTDPV